MHLMIFFICVEKFVGTEGILRICFRIDSIDCSLDTSQEEPEPREHIYIYRVNHITLHSI